MSRAHSAAGTPRFTRNVLSKAVVLFIMIFHSKPLVEAADFCRFYGNAKLLAKVWCCGAAVCVVPVFLSLSEILEKTIRTSCYSFTRAAKNTEKDISTHTHTHTHTHANNTTKRDNNDVHLHWLFSRR